MSKKFFLGLILTSIIVISLIALTGCVDPQKNPLIPTYNAFPRLGELTIYPAVISSNGTTTISVIAKDDDGDDLTITFREEQNRGSFQVTSSTMAIWTAPLAIGSYNIYAKVKDSTGAAVEGYKTLTVINNPPEILDASSDPSFINYNIQDTSLITIQVGDTDKPAELNCNVVLAGTSTCTGTLTLQSSTINDTITTFIYLWEQGSPPGFYIADFDITATDNIGNSDTGTLSIASGVI